MSKIKFIVAFIFWIILSNNAYSKIGKGDLNISDQTLDYLIQYLRNEFSTSFVISKDGKFGFYGLCPSGNCSGGPGATSTLLKQCKKATGDKCFIFAQTKKRKKVIRWNNINYKFPEGDFYYNSSFKNPKSKGEGIDKKITDDEIIDILNKYGLISSDNKVINTEDDEALTNKDLEGLVVSKSQIEEILDFFF